MWIFFGFFEIFAGFFQWFSYRIIGLSSVFFWYFLGFLLSGFFCGIWDLLRIFWIFQDLLNLLTFLKLKDIFVDLLDFLHKWPGFSTSLPLAFLYMIITRSILFQAFQITGYKVLLFKRITGRWLIWALIIPADRPCFR